MLGVQLEQRRGSFRSLCKLLSILSILTLAADSCTAQASQLITVHCGKTDSAVTQVTYKRGVDHPFDLNNAPSTIVDAVTKDVQNGDLNSLNAGLDQFNASSHSQLFTYSAPTLAYSASGNAIRTMKFFATMLETITHYPRFQQWARIRRQSKAGSII